MGHGSILGFLGHRVPGVWPFFLALGLFCCVREGAYVCACVMGVWRPEDTWWGIPPQALSILGFFLFFLLLLFEIVCLYVPSSHGIPCVFEARPLIGLTSLTGQ